MGDPQTATSYEVVGKLADGDVAELFLAKAAGGGSERLVVIKRIPRKATPNIELVKGFLEEAHIASRLQHPNIAQVYEVGKLGGSYFFAMEYVNGETLRALVEHAKSKKIQVPIRSVVTIAAGAVAALHHAHQRTGIDGKPMNIVHTDVSPTNVLVSREGIVKLVDFGISNARGRAGNAPLDKVPYWSPEQCRGETLDRRSDLFALGVVLWELITLEDLYHRGGDAKTRAAIENEEAPPPSARRYDVPPELDVIINRLLAKKPAERYQDADEVLAALEGLASKLGFQLSTAELARMMRLWFGNVPDPVIGTSEKPLVVKSEPVPSDLSVAPAADPIDSLLDTVRSAADIIRAAAAAIGGQRRSPTATPVVGDSVESTREDFAAVRDRILAQARKKKETRPPPAAITAAEAAKVTGGTANAADVAAVAGRAKRETLNSTNNAYSFITNVAGKAQEPIRNVTTTPPLGTALATAAGMESGGTPTSANTASSTSPSAETARGQIGKRTATYEAVAADAIDDAVAATSAMVSAGTDAAKNGASAVDTAATDVDGDATAKAVKAAEEARAADAAKSDAAKDASTATAAAAVATAASSDAKADTASDVKSDAKTSDATDASAKDAKTDAAAKDAAPDAAAKDAATDAKTDAAAKDAATDAKTDAAAKTDADAKDAKTDANVAKTDADAKDAKTDKVAKTDADAKDKAKEAPPASEARAVSADKRAAAARELDEDTSLAPKRPGWILPVGLAAGAVAVIAILFAVKGGDSDKPKRTTEQEQIATTNTADAAAMTPPVADAAVAVVETPDAAEVAMAPADAAEAIVPIDAPTQVAMATPDAAVEKPKDPVEKPKDPVNDKPKDPVTKPKDPVTKPKDPVDKPKDPVDKPKDPPKEPETAKSIEELVAGGDFAKANKACKTNTIFNGPRLTACTIAACNVKDTALAKRWIRAISKDARADLIKTCTAMGVQVEDPPPAP